MKYVFIDTNGYAGEQIPEFDPVFGDVPVDQRYSKDFLENCVYVNDDIEILTNSKYDTETGEFFVEETEMPPETGEVERPNVPEPPATEPDVWDALATAYREGVQSAYD